MSLQKKKITYIKATELANHFKISVRKLNEIFQLLKWSKKEEKNWITTEVGISSGAKQLNYRGTKYIEWDNEIKSNFHLISAINGFKSDSEIKQVVETKIIASNIKNTTTEEKKTSKKMTPKEKKEKGDKYEEHIAKFFREQGYYVWEHGKEKGVEDSNIDLFVKKDRFIYFIQCKNWETWKLDHNKVKATRMDVNDYLDDNPMLKEMINDFNWKILYVTSKECLTKGAYTYIKKNNELVEYQVIPMI